MFADLVRAHRRRLGMSQEDLATRAGLSVRGLRKIEAGRIAAPRPVTVRLLAEAFGLTAADRDRFCEAALSETTDRPARLPVPAQLPPDVFAFTGRRDELETLDRLRGTDPGSRAVVISALSGTAGVGKTALAVHWAHRVRDRFPDGQLYLDLRGYAATVPMRPIEALAEALSSLGVPAEDVPVRLEQAAGLYRSLLADRQMLVLLDNARSPDQVRPLLPAGEGSLVLVTSRHQLGGLAARDGAHRICLDVLLPGEAHALLGRVLGAQRVAAEPEATAALAGTCAYLPLALRVAAATLIDHPHRRIAEHVAELQGGDTVSALQVDGDEPAGVRAAFDLSYSSLPADERRVFRLLGRLPGRDISAAAAAALAGTSEREVGRLLDRLAGAHLADEHAPGRYRLHDLLHRYAADLAAAEDGQGQCQAATVRLFDHYLNTVGAAARLLYPHLLHLPRAAATEDPPPAGFTDVTAALAWLDTERTNLVAAVTDAAAHGPHRLAWLLADLLQGFFKLRMHAVDWQTVAEAALAAARAEADLPGQAAAHISLGTLHEQQSRYQEAIDHYAQALDLAQRAGWTECQAVVLNNIACVHRYCGRLPEAADHFGRALELNRQTGRLAGQAVNLSNLAVVHRDMSLLESPTVDQGPAGDPPGRSATPSGHVGNSADAGPAPRSAHLDRALECLTQALSVDRQIGDRTNEAATLRNLADLHRDTGRPTSALDLAESALTIARDIGHRRYQAATLSTLATIHLQLGHPRQALHHHEKALALSHDLGDQYLQARALIDLACTNAHLGQPEQARARADQALTIARQIKSPLLERDALAALNRKAADWGDHHGAWPRPSDPHAPCTAVQPDRSTSHVVPGQYRYSGAAGWCVPEGGAHALGETTQRVETAIRGLAAKTLSPGDRLPSERTMAEDLNAGRTTVRLVLAKLVVEGLVRAEHGRGYFVCERSPYSSDTS